MSGLALAKVVAKALVFCDEEGVEISGSPLVVERMKELLESSALWLVLNAPNSLLPISTVYEAGNQEDDGSGELVLPSSFLRLVSLKMKGWRQEVTATWASDSYKAKQQSSRFLRAGVNFPICVVDKDASTNDVLLKYYSVTPYTPHVVEHLKYISIISADWLDDDTTISVDVRLLDSMAYILSSLFCSTFELNDKAVLFEQRAAQQLTLLGA